MTWAFIFKTDEGDGANERLKTVLPHGGDRLLVYGVNTVEQGCETAKRIVEDEHCLLIELCGGFGAAGAKAVIEAIGNRVPVGHIEYLPEARARLSILPFKVES